MALKIRAQEKKILVGPNKGVYSNLKVYHP